MIHFDDYVFFDATNVVDPHTMTIVGVAPFSESASEMYEIPNKNNKLRYHLSLL